jgi:hypothetical protein
LHAKEVVVYSKLSQQQNKTPKTNTETPEPPTQKNNRQTTTHPIKTNNTQQETPQTHKTTNHNLHNCINKLYKQNV